MNRALITGVTGQDGAYLAQHLLAQGYDVFGTTRAASTADLSRLGALGAAQAVTLLDLDPTSPEQVEATLRKVGPTEIYHLAGPASVAASFADPAKSFQAIAGGSLGVLEGLRLAGLSARLVIAGSGEVFGNHGVASDETSPLSPLSPYAAAKSAAWQLVKTYRSAFGLHASVAVLFNHESPLRRPEYVTQKVVRSVAAIRAGTERTLALGDVSVIRDWGWAPDFVIGLQAMAARPDPDDFVIATGESHSLAEFVELAFSLAGLTASDHVTHDPALHRPADVTAMRANPEKARSRLGWQAKVHFREVVENMLAAALAR